MQEKPPKAPAIFFSCKRKRHMGHVQAVFAIAHMTRKIPLALNNSELRQDFAQPLQDSGVA
jgi:hypothetical protein